MQHGFHAMSVDELRADFPVTKWDSRDGVTQTWFAGAHSDVGGGYAPSESRLSDLSLSWMLGNLSGLGVKLTSPMPYVPNFATATAQPIHTPWTSPPFDRLGRTPRVAAAGDDFHPSVRQRWKDDPGYRPQALQGIW